MLDKLFNKKYDVIQQLTPQLYKIMSKDTQTNFLMKRLKCIEISDMSLLEILVYFNSVLLNSNLHVLESIELNKKEEEVYMIFQYQPHILRHIITKPILTKSQKLFIIFNIGNAIQFFHQNEIIIRYLDSDYIFISESCHVKLSGRKKMSFLKNKKENKEDRETEELKLIKTDFALNQNCYASPEQLLHGKISLATDIWSFGVIALEIMSNRNIFNCKSLLELLQKMCYFSEFPTQELLDSMSISQDNQKVFELLNPMRLIDFMNPKNQLYELIEDKEICELIDTMLSFNPKKRPMIGEILKSPVFKELYTEEEPSKLNNFDITKKIKKVIYSSNVNENVFIKPKGLYKTDDDDYEESKNYLEKLKTSNVKELLETYLKKNKVYGIERTGFSKLLISNVLNRND